MIFRAKDEQKWLSESLHIREVKIVKTVMICLLLAIALMIGAAGAERSAQEIEVMLKQACYINPDFGTMVHSVPDCRIVHPKYLPLTKVEYTEEIKANYSFCPVCCVDEHYGKTDVAETEEPWKEESEIIKSETMEREQQLGMRFNLWNWEQNADFQEEHGHSATYIIANGVDIKRIRPDKTDVPFDDALAFAVAKLLTYDSQLTNEQLDDCWLASEYIDDYPYLLDEIKNMDHQREQTAYGETGIWHFTWWDVTDPMEWEQKNCMATAYVDGKTGTVLEIRTFTRGYNEEVIVRRLLP